MPNHVKNKIEFQCDDEVMKSIFEKYNTHYNETPKRAYDESIVCHSKDDKNKIGWYDEITNIFITRDKDEERFGMPEDYEYIINDTWDHFPDFDKVIPQPENIFRGNLSTDDEERCASEGIPTWYDWNRENWGTKWNSYSLKKINENVFTFDTAWNSVPKIITRMSKDFPDVRIVYTYADEDTGYNCGKLIFQDGEIVSYKPTGGSKEAYELAFELRPECKDDYILVDGDYKYKEEEE